MLFNNIFISISASLNSINVFLILPLTPVFLDFFLEKNISKAELIRIVINAALLDEVLVA